MSVPLPQGRYSVLVQVVPHDLGVLKSSLRKRHPAVSTHLSTAELGQDAPHIIIQSNIEREVMISSSAQAATPNLRGQQPSFNRCDSAGPTPRKSRALRAELLDPLSWTGGLEGILTNFAIDCRKDLRRSLCVGQQSRAHRRPSTRGTHVNTTFDRRFVFAATDSISIDAFRVDSSGARRPMYWVLAGSSGRPLCACSWHCNIHGNALYGSQGFDLACHVATGTVG